MFNVNIVWMFKDDALLRILSKSPDYSVALFCIGWFYLYIITFLPISFKECAKMIQFKIQIHVPISV